MRRRYPFARRGNGWGKRLRPTLYGRSMLPILEQLLDRLRGDDHNPLHALDRWLLSRIEREEPSSLWDLIVSSRMRRAPRRRGPELEPGDVRRWVIEADAERALLEAHVVDPARPDVLRWSLTERGRERRKALTGAGERLAWVIAAVTRAPDAWTHTVRRLREQDEVDVGEPPPPRVGLPRINRSRGDQDMTPDQASANLARIDHIVVLMMENRSFDHMLGYLDLLDGQTEVEGLGKAEPRDRGTPVKPPYLVDTAFPKSMDPPHKAEEIAKQLNNGAMDGFIESFARVTDVEHPELVMGYYTHRELPVFDFLAHNFLLCDRWFCSVPAATWANRLYALTGKCHQTREDLASGLLADLAAFVRYLEEPEDPDTWRWYSWDPGTLRFADREYAANLGRDFHHDHFRRVVQHAMEPDFEPAGDEAAEIPLGTGLLEDLANDDLPAVTWIDPNFVDLSILSPSSNDDHPPSDVRAGQDLVLMILRALTESACWAKTMFVITYDEHGGFYDHVRPDDSPEADPQFETYGVRVPAFVVSPFVDPHSVSHTTFDHAAIPRTILERFGRHGAVEEMAEQAPRIGKAKSLGRLLTNDPGPHPKRPDLGFVSATLDSWRHRRTDRRSPASPELRSPDAKPAPITGFAAEYMEGSRRLRRGVVEDGKVITPPLPAGHP
jgi:phospholipase C